MKSENSISLTENDISRSKAYTVIFIFIALLMVGIFLLSKYVNINKLSTSNTSVASASDIVDINSYSDMKNSDMDSNGNGIPNWQEVALGLDPTKSNQGVENLNLADNKADEKIDYFSNFTKLISRDIYTSGQYKAQNNQIDLNAINSQLVTSLTNLYRPPRLGVVNIVASPTKEDYTKYFSDMAVLLYYLGSSEGKDMAELDSNMKNSTQDWKFTKEYTRNIYALCEYYKNIKVPKDLSELHKDAIYQCQDYALTLYGFMQYKDDPIKTQISISKYPEVTTKVHALLKAYSNQVKNKGYSASDIKNGQIYYLVK